ncbi:hypothetical protein ElyMa_004355100 [Elysia marginata]|uniref:Uncharacterized protein n=1 Tax=Elysia marginata TaxID=1093978 RepID=A0AAV4H5E6_9GAST|nr:hypothetical protein ElyMa_004355100 [Elysia marginata]
MKPMQKLRRMFALGADPRNQNSSPTECENLYSAGASVLNAMVTMLKNDNSSDRFKRLSSAPSCASHPDVRASQPGQNMEWVGLQHRFGQIEISCNMSGRWLTS